MKNFSYEPWPALPYEEFKSTAHLLHMLVQALGKLKLNTPFEPHWANVALWLTSQGLTTGPIPYKTGSFSIDIDLINHQIICASSWGKYDKLDLVSTSVAKLTNELFSLLHLFQIDIHINPKPQEIENPILFDQNIEQRIYDRNLANAWWRILMSSYKVMQRYHSHFDGETPPIGLMWGTFDLRDARYNGVHVPTIGPNSGYIRRNAMNEAQVEIGWWAGNEIYPKPAYYSFTYPQPENIQDSKIKPEYARWHNTLMEFVLDYDDLRKAKDIENDLFNFFDSTYQVGSKLAKWDPRLVTLGEPV